MKTSWIRKILDTGGALGSTVSNGRRTKLTFRYSSLIVFTALFSSCGAPPGIQSSLRNPDPQVKILALIQVAEEDRKDLFPDVLANLRSEDETIRFLSGVVARKLSGQDVDFKPFASTQEQEAAIARWQRWWEQRSTTGSLDSTDTTAVDVSRDYQQMSRARPGE